MKNEIIIKRQGREWKALSIIATVILLISILVKSNLYYIHIYFYVAAIIALILAKFNYATLNSEGILIFIGLIPKRSSVLFKWSSIDSFEFKYLPKDFKTPIKGVTDGLGTSDVEDDRQLKSN